jgi:hypothetical protein
MLVEHKPHSETHEDLYMYSLKSVSYTFAG